MRAIPKGTDNVMLSLLSAASALFLAIGSAQAQTAATGQGPAAQSASTAAEAAAAQQRTGFTSGRSST